MDLYQFETGTQRQSSLTLMAVDGFHQELQHHPSKYNRNDPYDQLAQCCIFESNFLYSKSKSETEHYSIVQHMQENN